jgi:hypothetical protein
MPVVGQMAGGVPGGCWVSARNASRTAVSSCGSRPAARDPPGPVLGTLDVGAEQALSRRRDPGQRQYPGGRAAHLALQQKPEIKTVRVEDRVERAIGQEHHILAVQGERG